LFNNFLNQNPEVEAIIVSDMDGFVIAGEKRMDINIEIVSFLTAVINPLIERVRQEFSFKKFGTASIDTEEHRLLFVLINEQTTLSLVIQSLGSVDIIAPYAYFLAEKAAQILEATSTELIQMSIPDFKFGGEMYGEVDRLKNQLYQSKVDQGGIYRFKFIVIGDHEVGKTSIIRRFVEDNFLEKYRATIGLNILSHTFNAFGNKINIMLWDIGAQKFFKRYRKTYYNGAQAVFIVFDISNRESFDNVNYWHNELKEFIHNKDLPIIIVGNKIDLDEERAVTYEEGVELAKDLSKLSVLSESSMMSDYSDLSEFSGSHTKISYIETSAKTGNRIQDAFNLISYHFILKAEEKELGLLQNKIVDEINTIIDINSSLNLVFLSQNELWNPTLQILSEIKKLGKPVNVKDKKKEKKLEYSSGLVLTSYTYDSYKVSSDADGVVCFFDAREKETVDPAWIEIISNIIANLEKNKVISVGLRVTEEENWSKLIEGFKLDEEAEERMISLLFFRIKEESKLDIYEQLSVTLDSIKNLSFNY